jgi:flagellar hook-length control protein FliK
MDRLYSSSIQSQPHGAARAQLAIDARVGTPMFADELAAKATFIHERGLQSASLRLSPEHLGPMEIQITIKDDKASVWFGAAHAETRAALEQALPRLREMLGSQGLSLSDAGVFREPPRDQARAYVATRADGVVTETDQREIVIRNRSGLLDAYA